MVGRGEGGGELPFTTRTSAEMRWTRAVVAVLVGGVPYAGASCGNQQHSLAGILKTAIGQARTSASQQSL